MNVQEFCSKRVVTVDRWTPLQQAAATMRERHVGALLVTDCAGQAAKAIGMVTDRDFVLEVIARGVAADQLTVGDLVKDGKLATIPIDAGIAETIAAMEESGVRRLLVTSKDGQIAGIVSFDDVLDALARELGGLANVMRTGMLQEINERGTLDPSERRIRIGVE